MVKVYVVRKSGFMEVRRGQILPYGGMWLHMEVRKPENFLKEARGSVWKSESSKYFLMEARGSIWKSDNSKCFLMEARGSLWKFSTSTPISLPHHIYTHVHSRCPRRFLPALSCSTIQGNLQGDHHKCFTKRRFQKYNTVHLEKKINRYIKPHTKKDRNTSRRDGEKIHKTEK